MSPSPESPKPDRARRRCLAAVPALATALWLRPALADPRVVRESRPLMGTRVEIVAQGHVPGQAAPAVAAAFDEMARLERMMSRYRADSTVAELQRAAGRRPLAVAPELLAVLKMARGISERSGGRFDVTVGAFSGWGFDPAQQAMPGPDELARQRRFVNYRDLAVDEKSGQAYLRRPGMKLDLG